LLRRSNTSVDVYERDVTREDRKKSTDALRGFCDRTLCLLNAAAFSSVPLFIQMMN